MLLQFWSKFALLSIGALLCLLSGCASTKVDFSGPMTARPPDAGQVAAASKPNGAIYQASAGNYNPLFEDRRARNIGDTLVVMLQENLQSSQSSNAAASRSASAEVSVPNVSGIPLGNRLERIGVDASGSSNFSSKGSANVNNRLSGTVAVTVVEVLSNGNLVVAGEKQIGTNNEKETIRLSGVVNPNTIVNFNQVSSSQIADARIEYSGEGTISAATVAGWLSKLFFSYLPF